jgi:hypothetical protein
MSRRVQIGANYKLIQKATELKRIESEILRMHPKTEVTIEGSSEIAKGKIVEWFPNRKFFTVQWIKLPTDFQNQSGSTSGLRVFFKVQMFSTQVVFKSTTLRRINVETTEKTFPVYHYRIPEEIFQQERRGALRVPLESGSASICTNEGTFQILDLSITGAKISNSEKINTPPVGTEWKNARLFLGKHQVNGKEFKIKITRKNDDECTVQFKQITDQEKVLIKQYLIEALRIYCEKKFKSGT